jgi:membrane fusion protein (multidrug efflux system)
MSSPSLRPTDAVPAPAPPRRSRAKILLPVLAGGAAIVAGVVWYLGRGKESTDDAFVEAHVANVAARIPGQVIAVRAKDNQQVNAGDILVELDDRDAKVRIDTGQADLESAQANLAAAETQLALTEKTADANLRQARGGVVQATASAGASKAMVDQVRADVIAAESRQRLAQLELQRAEALLAETAISQADYDARKAAYDQAVAAVEQARARAASAKVGIDNAEGTVMTAQGRLDAAQAGPEQVAAARAAVGVARARVAQAQAALEQAQLNLSYTTVRAPLRGAVSRRTVEPGQTVDPARPLMAVTALDDVWVVANFKEDQVADIRAGEPVKIKIDTYGGESYDGHVESLAAGSGARFSLLPPDNATGNFTKVVQRIPVLIRFDKLPEGRVLRPGMSASVTVTVK